MNEIYSSNLFNGTTSIASLHYTHRNCHPRLHRPSILPYELRFRRRFYERIKCMMTWIDRKTKQKIVENIECRIYQDVFRLHTVTIVTIEK